VQGWLGVSKELARVCASAEFEFGRTPKASCALLEVQFVKVGDVDALLLGKAVRSIAE
jgi:hypothetical protein